MTSITRSNALAIYDQDDDTRLYLGPARRAELLEVVTIVRDDGSDLVIHAMKTRSKYEQLPLRKLTDGGENTRQYRQRQTHHRRARRATRR